MCQTSTYLGTYKDMLSERGSQRQRQRPRQSTLANGATATLHRCNSEVHQMCHMSAYLGTCEDMLLKRQSEAAAAAVDGGIGNAATLRGGSTKCAV